MSDELRTVSKEVQLSNKWIQARLDEYADLADKFDLELTLKEKTTPFAQFYDNGRKAGTHFSFLLADREPDNLIEYEKRLAFFTRSLAKTLHSSLRTFDSVSFVLRSLFGSQQLNRTDEKGILELLNFQINDHRPHNDRPIPISFGMQIPLSKVHEEVEQSLRDKLDRMQDMWASRTPEFELMTHWSINNMKKSIDDQWKDAVALSASVHLDDHDESDSMLPIEKRIQYFIQKVIIPDLKQLIKDGYTIRLHDYSDTTINYTVKAPQKISATVDNVERVLLAYADRSLPSKKGRIWIEVIDEGR